MPFAIETEGLVKIFRSFWSGREVRAVDGITLSVEQGSTFGLLGLPSLLGGPKPVRPRLVRLAADAVVIGPIAAAEATIRFLPSPRDEITELAPHAVTAAAAANVGLTISRVDPA